jgi:hypothetical protein
MKTMEDNLDHLAPDFNNLSEALDHYSDVLRAHVYEVQTESELPKGFIQSTGDEDYEYQEIRMEVLYSGGDGKLFKCDNISSGVDGKDVTSTLYMLRGSFDGET